MATPSDQPNPRGHRRERARAREEAAWALREQGYSTRAIARRLDLSQTRVVTLLRAVEDRIAANAEAIARRVKARQSCQIEHMLSELMAAWEQSKAPPRTTRTKTSGDGRTEETVEVRATAGDVKFLAEARALLAAERALWGLGAEAEDARVLDVDTLRASLLEIKRRRATESGAAL
jgi:DNA-binding CsgD family transcriptional regulator